MILWTIGYLIIAVITALGIAGYGNNGVNWGAKRCVVLGAFWIISLPIIGWFMLRDKFFSGDSS